MNHNYCVRIITLVFVVLIAASTAVAEPSWVSLDGTQGLKKPTATVMNSSNSEAVIRFNIPGFSSDDYYDNGKTYQSLRFPGYFTTMEVGKAQLPVISEYVAVPANADIRVTVVEFTETTLSGYEVKPYQRLLLEDEQQQPFEIDQAFYEQNSFYPEITAEVDEPGIWRHIRMANLKVNPVRYNPVTGELKVCTNITVRLEFSSTDAVDANVSADRPVAREYDGMYRRNVLNYDWLDMAVEDDSRSPDADVDGYDYLIISPGCFIKYLQPFIEWKNSRGINTEVVSINQVGADTAAIKAYIANEYFTNHIKYVLFVGNETYIPGYEEDTTANRGDTIFCDYYYSLVDGDDLFAEIAVGRFSVENAAQVDNMVRKSILYESNPPRGDWLENALLIAHAEQAPVKYQGCKEQVRTADYIHGNVYDILTPNFTTAYGALESRGGNLASNADVISAINAGQRVVNYRGHGADDYWSYWNVWGECFSNAEVDLLDNGEMTPVVFGIACWNNNLRSETPCLGEAFTRGDDAAVAFLGASVPSYTDINHEYDKNIFELIFDAGLNVIGDVTNEASVHLIKQYHEDAIQNARSYLWLGDPSLNVIFYGDPGPAAPVLATPDDGANLAAPAQPVLDWNEVPNATSYEIVIDDAVDFVTPIGGQDNLAATEWMTQLLETGTYYWRVRACADEIRGAWSEVRTLNIGITTPTLYAPADELVISNDDSVTLTWHEVAGINSFLVQVDDDPLFDSPVIDGHSSEGAEGYHFYYLTPRLAAGTYYWRVKGDDYGLSWSSVWQFTIESTVGDIVMHVSDMDIDAFLDEQFRFTGTCSVSVVDQFENPVPGVDVKCYWKKYKMDGTAFETTNDRGIAILSSRTIDDPYAPFCFTITDVSLSDAIYDPVANLVTRACESGWIYKEGDLENNPLPTQFALGQNYPNPFNPSTEITFALPSPGHVKLAVYNIKGQRVASLVDRRLGAGNHTVTWDGTGLASGIYIYRISTEENSASRKMLLLK